MKFSLLKSRICVSQNMCCDGWYQYIQHVYLLYMHLFLWLYYLELVVAYLSLLHMNRLATVANNCDSLNSITVRNGLLIKWAIKCGFMFIFIRQKVTEIVTLKQIQLIQYLGVVSCGNVRNHCIWWCWGIINESGVMFGLSCLIYAYSERQN